MTSTICLEDEKRKGEVTRPSANCLDFLLFLFFCVACSRIGRTTVDATWTQGMQVRWYGGSKEEVSERVQLQTHTSLYFAIY